MIIDYKDKIYLQDCRGMHQLPSESIHLVITSPPYNVTKTYDQNLTLQEYLGLIDEMIAECSRVLVPRGIIAINIANVGRKPYIPLDAYIIKLLMGHNFTIFQEIIWNKEASAGGSCAWGSWKSASNPSIRDIHEYIILGIKANTTEHLQIPFEEVGEIPKLVENRRIKIKMTELLSNVWEFQTESAKRVNHPAPFPIDLPLRLILLFSKTGDVILDPFIGSGTVAIASIISKRHYVGYEINSEFVQTAQDRVKKINGG